MNRIAFLLIIIFSVLGCKSESSQTKKSPFKISDLNSVEKQSAFLMDIFNKDQQVRKDEKLAVKTFGYDSPQHKSAINILMNTDDKNLVLIEEYLSAHGHPIRDTHGREATDTPWLVIHHAGMQEDIRKKHFSTFYKAYQDGQIHGNALTMYLNRMYNLKFNTHIEWNRPYKEEEEIDTLIKSLSLGHLIN